MTQVEWKNGKQTLIRADVYDFSYLDIIEAADSLPADYCKEECFQKDVAIWQTYNGTPIGYVLKFAIEHMKMVAKDEFGAIFDVCDQGSILRFKNFSFERRCELFDLLSNKLRKVSNFECVKGWRDEKYAVYADSAPYVVIERCLSSLFGIVTYGVHVNGYVIDPITKELKIWVARRSFSKPTWPGKLDNIIGGGVAYPDGIYETFVKEAMEEASLSIEVIDDYCKPAGLVSHFRHEYKGRYSDESCFITAQVLYVYDLQLPEGFVPKPNDNEVDGFQLMTLQNLLDAMREEEFKNDSALVTVDFLVRHGYINVENEPNFLRIVSKMHRTMPFPTRN